MAKATHHSHNQAQSLQQIDQLALVTRFCPTEQRSPLHSQDFLLLTERLKLSSSVTFARQIFILAEDPNLPTNRLRRTLVVAGDADDTDPSGFAVRNGGADLRPGRVEHANERDERKTLFETGVVGRAL